MSELKTVDARTLAQWRRWLAAHHDSESEVWLIFYKQHSGITGIAYEDAVDEGLCFGWVDSLVKRLDDARFARKFTPRRPDSVWSDSNRKRYAKLKASGRLRPAGVDRPPTNRRPEKPPKFALPAKLPRYIETALRKRAKAWRAFEQLAPSHRRHYVGWIDVAKQEETKRRRLREVVRALAAGEKLGLK